jgi:hypothetical protein
MTKKNKDIYILSFVEDVQFKHSATLAKTFMNTTANFQFEVKTKFHL